MARITILSDDLDTRMVTVAALEGEHDIRALGWPTGDARSLGAAEPDVLVVDADLLFRPELLDILRPPTGERPGVVVLLDPDDLGRIVPSFERGADDYLLKPVDASDLKGKVSALLAQRLGLLPSAVDPISISDSGRILRDPDLAGDGLYAQLGRYQIRGILGRGGYGVVYRAWDLALSRFVALKVLPKELHGNDEAVARFFLESTAIARLNHPNIVRFYEVGSYHGRYYFTMELAEGRTLKAIAEETGTLDCWEAAYYVAGIAEALSALNSIGLVHRDVKPENVIVTSDGQVKLIDFGLVRIRDTAGITNEDDVLGTPYFMCPEYIRAPGMPDIRYDLYALGVTFFNLVTGEYPFDGKNAASVMEKHLRCPAPRVSSYQPGVPFVAERVIERLLRKDPEQRPQTPEEVLVMLRPLLRRRRAA